MPYINDTRHEKVCFQVPVFPGGALRLYNSTPTLCRPPFPEIGGRRRDCGSLSRPHARRRGGARLGPVPAEGQRHDRRHLSRSHALGGLAASPSLPASCLRGDRSNLSRPRARRREVVTLPLGPVPAEGPRHPLSAECLRKSGDIPLQASCPQRVSNALCWPFARRGVVAPCLLPGLDAREGFVAPCHYSLTAMARCHLSCTRNYPRRRALSPCFLLFPPPPQ
jgi:hypothetical protein